MHMFGGCRILPSPTLLNLKTTSRREGPPEPEITDQETMIPMKTSLSETMLTCRLAWTFCLVALFSGTGLAVDRPNVLWIIAVIVSPVLTFVDRFF